MVKFIVPYIEIGDFFGDHDFSVFSQPATEYINIYWTKYRVTGCIETPSIMFISQRQRIKWSVLSHMHGRRTRVICRISVPNLLLLLYFYMMSCRRKKRILKR